MIKEVVSSAKGKPPMVFGLTEAEIFIMYFCMAGMLIFRPKGLFQGAEARKI